MTVEAQTHGTNAQANIQRPPLDAVGIKAGGQPQAERPTLSTDDARSRALEECAQATKRLAKDICAEEGAVRKGVKDVAGGMSRRGFLRIAAAAAGGAVMRGLGTQAAADQAAHAANAGQVAATAPTRESLEKVSHAMGGGNFEIAAGSDAKVWGLLCEGERKWWIDRSNPEKAKSQAYENYRRWSLANAGNSKDFPDSIPPWEMNHWARVSRPEIPKVGDSPSEVEARDAVERFARFPDIEGKAMDKSAFEHYRKMGLAPKPPENAEETGRIIMGEVKANFDRIAQARDLLEKFSPGNDGDKALKFKAEETLFRYTEDATARERYMRAIPVRGVDDRTLAESITAAENAFDRGIESALKKMPGGEKRLDILRKYNVVVTDGAASMSPEYVGVVENVLENTPPHILETDFLRGGIVQDTTRPSDINKEKESRRVASYDLGLTGIRNMYEGGKAHLHHELGHGVHHKILAEEKFAEFSRLGGWKYRKEKDGEAFDIPNSHTGMIMRMPSEYWLKPPLSTVAMEYGRTNPMEDFATLYEEYTGDTKKLIEKAVFQYKESDDKKLMKKVGWMMDNVFKDLKTGQTYVYDGGKMNAERSGYDYITKKLKELGLGGKPEENGAKRPKEEDY
ncbi:MAG: hypothetical protein V1875_04535 [Candidatus Altiarchaeota archaeon]